MRPSPLLPSYPQDLRAGRGIKLARAGGAFTVGLDEEAIAGLSGQSVVAKTATVTIPMWSAFVADGASNCRPADTGNPNQRQAVLAVTALGGAPGTTVIGQSSNDLFGPAVGFTPGKPLYVGVGGVLTQDAPTSGWRQQVATVISDGHVVVNLGEAVQITSDDVLIAAGGFASPATASEVATGQAAGKYTTPAALAGAPFQPDAPFPLPVRTKSLRQWFVELSTEGADLRMLGFVGDGASHPLSQRFGSLADARVVFPRANALSEEIDGHAIQRLIDLAVAADANDSTPGGACVVLPRGSLALTSFPIDSTATANCHVFSPGPAKIKCVGSALGVWTHGTQTNRANGPISWSGVDLDSSSSATTTGLTTFFGDGGAGRGSAVVVENTRIANMSIGWRVGNCPRGLRADNVCIFGPDFQMQVGGGVEIIATADCAYGCFSYKFTNCLIANYTWGFNATAANLLEGVVFENCRSYNGFGLCRLITTKPNYKSLLWTFQDCDWEGAGFALDMTNVRLLKVDGGYWFMHGEDTKTFPASAQTTGGERRMLNLHGVQGFDFTRMEMVVGGVPDGQPLPTNLVVANVDADCSIGVFDSNVITTDHVTASCIFRLSGSKASTIVERNTRINYTWDAAGPTAICLYSGAGDAAYQISYGDVAANNGTVSSEGVYSFSGTNVVTTDANGRATIQLPRRAPGTLPFFRNSPSVRAVSGNSAGGASSVTLVSTSSTQFVVEAAAAAPNVTIAIYWEASGK